MILDQIGSNGIGLIVGAVFTVMILSYLLGDNFLFRLATHILIGGVAAYVTVTVFADVLVKRIWEPVVQRGDLAAIIVAGVGLIFGAMLLLKAAPQLAWIGNIPIGYLLGVGAAVALGGALFGTLGPQVVATATPAPLFNAGIFDGRTLLLNGLILFVTATTLMSFGFNRVARGGILSGVNSIGRFFLAIALGATFALVYVASVTLLVDRVQGISDAINLFIPPP